MDALTSAPAASALGLSDAGIIALLGYGIVFLGLIFLMIVVMIVGACFIASAKRKAAKICVPEPVEEEPAAPAVAPGSAGNLMLHDVPPATAAMLMAIVAKKTGKPLNELRFISIREVKES